MKILYEGKEIQQIVSSYTLSGDIKQVARKIEFSLAYSSTDAYLPKVNIELGKTIQWIDNAGTTIFIGRVFFEEEGDSKVIKYTAYDNLIYLSKSKTSKNFVNVSPENIVRSLANEFSLKVGSVASTGVSLTFPALNKSPYEMIMTAYTQAKNKTGKKYFLVCRNGLINMIEQGTLLPVTLESGKHITQTKYSQSVENMINKVIIIDKEGNRKGSVDNASDVTKYGLLQSVVQEQDNKDATAEARNTLSGIEKKVSIEALGNIKCIAGYSIMVKSIAGVTGRFYIEKDSHDFENGQHTMSLTLSFENVMDEKEIEESSKESS